ncbi:hypothetical protein [Flavobacterium sp.]|uniref:hypothetical protein n=1 Tax=Flavobacterium sp. TaxID=239 RepID=UPI0037537F21
MIFHNTIGESGRELNEAIKHNNTQNSKILAFFKANQNVSYTRCEALKQLIETGILSEKVQNSSISRAFNTLEKANLLHRTGEKRKGDLGRIQDIWTLNK